MILPHNCLVYTDNVYCCWSSFQAKCWPTWCNERIYASIWRRRRARVCVWVQTINLYNISPSSPWKKKEECVTILSFSAGSQCINWRPSSFACVTLPYSDRKLVLHSAPVHAKESIRYSILLRASMQHVRTRSLVGPVRDCTWDEPMKSLLHWMWQKRTRSHGYNSRHRQFHSRRHPARNSI